MSDFIKNFISKKRSIILFFWIKTKIQIKNIKQPWKIPENKKFKEIKK